MVSAILSYIFSLKVNLGLSLSCLYASFSLSAAYDKRTTEIIGQLSLSSFRGR